MNYQEVNDLRIQRTQCLDFGCMRRNQLSEHDDQDMRDDKLQAR